jgi:hypothetical protein
MQVSNIAGKHVHGKMYNKSAIRLNKALIVEIISGLLVLLFSYASISKLIKYDTFIGQLRKSPYLENYAQSVAWLIPVIECIIAFLLVFKRTRLSGLFASFAMMLAFTVYVYMMLHFSYYLPCSCGGVLSKMTWPQHFWFNIVFTLLSLAGIVLTTSGNKAVFAE